MNLDVMKYLLVYHFQLEKNNKVYNYHELKRSEILSVRFV